jgi:hypothetical protein
MITSVEDIKIESLHTTVYKLEYVAAANSCSTLCYFWMQFVFGWMQRLAGEKRNSPASILVHA